MSGGLSTHVLDTARGVPAEGVTVTVRRGGAVIATAVTNADGRTDAPLVPAGLLVAGDHEITFDVSAVLGPDAFYDVVPVRFRVTDPSRHHHVPLLVSPFGYATYRGS